MRRTGSRTIKVNKAKLIEKIKENKAAHEVAYAKAVIAYKKEAIKQLTTQIADVQEGSLNAKLNLTTPVNNIKNYDKIIDMFEWEVDEVVELEQQEFWKILRQLKE